MLYRISYDLLTPGRDYAGLTRGLTAHGAERILLSDWLLPTNATPEVVWTHFARFLDSSDRLVVDEVTTSLHWSRGRLLASETDMLRLRRHIGRRAA